MPTDRAFDGSLLSNTPWHLPRNFNQWKRREKKDLRNAALAFQIIKENVCLGVFQILVQ